MVATSSKKLRWRWQSANQRVYGSSSSPHRVAWSNSFSLAAFLHWSSSVYLSLSCTLLLAKEGRAVFSLLGCSVVVCCHDELVTDTQILLLAPIGSFDSGAVDSCKWHSEQQVEPEKPNFPHRLSDKMLFLYKLLHLQTYLTLWLWIKCGSFVVECY